MRTLTAGEVRAMIAALNEEYVKGRNEGNWHIYTLSYEDGRSVRGRVADLQGDDLTLTLDVPTNDHVELKLSGVVSVLVEAD